MRGQTSQADGFRVVRLGVPGHRCTATLVAIAATVCWNLELRAQPPASSAGAAGGTDVEQADAPDDRRGLGMAGDTDEMREMASSMRSMADMCRMMMQREQQYRPYVMAAGAIVGAALVLALLLFVIIEIQWIRFLAVRIRTEKRKLL